MYICAEQLPIEIWLAIFQYLEGHDLFQAFQNLNSYFNQILTSHHLSFYIRLKVTDNNHQQYLTNPYWSDSVLNRIVCLRPIVQSRSGYFLEFLRWHAKKLTRLQSLSIKTNLLDITSLPYLCQALQVFDRLEYLSLTCIPNETLFETILSLPALRICQLILRESMTIINHFLNVNSHIKQLIVVFLGTMNYSWINLLLVHTPKLKRCEIAGPYFSFDQIVLFNKPSFILSELRILKLKLDGGYFSPDCFTYLHTIMPVLKEFYFHYYKHILPDAFLGDLTSHWWSIIESIQHIDIFIKGHIYTDQTFYNNALTELQNSRQVLHERRNQSNGRLKVEWTEQDFVRLRLVEITILKS